MSQNCTPHSARYSGLPITCSALGTPWNFRGAKMAQLCSRTGLVGLVSKGRWRFCWANRRYGRNLGSLKRTKLKKPIKWVKAYRFSSSNERAPHTMCCEGDVHCCVCQWWGNTAPRCTSKAEGKRCLLLQIPAATPMSSTQDKTMILGGTDPQHSSWQCKESHCCCCHGPLASLAMGDSGTSTVLTRYEPMQLQSLRLSERTTGRGPVLIHAIGWSIQNINKDGHVDGVWCLPNIWQKVINKEGEQLYWRYINVVSLGIKPWQKYWTVAIAFYPKVVITMGAKHDWDFRISDLVSNPVGTDT